MSMQGPVDFLRASAHGDSPETISPLRESLVMENAGKLPKLDQPPDEEVHEQIEDGVRETAAAEEESRRGEGQERLAASQSTTGGSLKPVTLPSPFA